MKTTAEYNEIDFGKILQEHCRARRISKAALSRKLGITYGSLLYTLKTKTIDIDKLVLLCHGLNHNFLLDLAMQLPLAFANNVKENTLKEDEINLLRERVKILEAEKAILLLALSPR